jgi:hypothetical protein
MHPAKLLAVLDAAAAPVDHGAEHIKNQGLYVRDVHLYAPLYTCAGIG